MSDIVERLRQPIEIGPNALSTATRLLAAGVAEIERLRARLAAAEAVASAAHAFLNVETDEDGFALDQTEYALLVEAVEAWEVVR